MDSSSQARPPIEDVLRRHTPDWLTLSGVVGTASGESEGRPCIKVYVTGEEGSFSIPGVVDGYPVVVEPTGEFRAC